MPNLKKKKTRKETARRPGGNSGTWRRENSGAAALEKRRRKPRVSWPPRRALLPGEGPAQDPAQPVGPARGACEPGGHTPARPGWGGDRPPSSPCAKRPHASHQHHAPAHTRGYQTFSGPSSTFHGKPVYSGQGARGKSSDRAAARGRARRAVNASETQRRPAGRVAVIS